MPIPGISTVGVSSRGARPAVPANNSKRLAVSNVAGSPTISRALPIKITSGNDNIGDLLNFDGVDDEIDAGLESWQFSDNSPFTYEIIVVLNSTQDQEFQGNSGSRRQFGIKNGKLALRGWTGTEQLISGNTTLKVGKNILGVSYNGTSATFFLNNSEDGTANFSYNEGSGYRDGINMRGFFGYIDGQVSEVRVWNYARTITEHNSDIDKRLGGAESGLIAYYPMNEGTGSTVFDNSLNDNHGTINGPSWDLLKGEVILNWTNIKDRADIAIYDQDNKLLDYYFESFDTVSKVSVIWVYKNWVLDGTDQIKIGYGGRTVDDSVVASTVFDKENGLEIGYLLNETSGNALDVTSNNNDGTVSGTGVTQDAKGIINGAYNFGTDNTVSNVITVNPFDLSFSTQFTALAWVDGSTQSDNTRFINYGNASANEGGFILGQTTSGLIRTYTDSGNRNWNSLNGNTVLDDNNWHLFVLTYDGSTRIIYYDEGIQDNSDNPGYDNSPTNSAISFANRLDQLSESHDGKIDDMRVYSVALSQTDIKAIYNAGKIVPDFFRQKAST